MPKTQSIPSLTAKAQKVFNQWIRFRDKDKGCVSCPSPNVDHASHYVAVGGCSALRFNEINVNGSCAKCNTFLHGNIIGYRKGLIERYSLADVEMLEDQRHDLKKWTRAELLEIIEKYKL